MIRVFVVGSPRGGTTVTQKLISEKGRLFTCPETAFFARLVGNSETRFFSRNRFQEGFWMRQKYQLRQTLRLSAPRDWSDLEVIPCQFDNRHIPMRKLARVFTDGFDRMARNYDLSGWVEKSPVHLHYLNEIQRYVPNAWIVHIIRDGRDVVASRKDAAQRYGKHWSYYYSDIFWNVDRWNNDIAKSANHVGDARHLFIDYETLCDHTSGAISTILQHIGIAQSQNVVENYTRFSLSRVDEEWKHQALYGRIEKSKSKWMHVFSDEERAKAENLFAPIPMPLQKKLDDFKMKARNNENAPHAEATQK